MAKKRLSISLQFSLLLTLVLMLNGAAFYFMLKNVYMQELRAQAQTVVANVEAFGTWVAKSGRVWVENSPDSFLGELEMQTIGKPNETHHFYSKNPALAQREFSETVAESTSPAKFRMTSDNVMNPANKPDLFETRALRAITNENLTEYYDTTGDSYRYAKPIFHKESCIACHGNSASAPSDVITRYGSQNGFGFKVGDVAGIISVTIPQRNLLGGAVSIFGLLELIAIFVSVGIILWFVRRSIIIPVSDLTKVAEKISRGEDAPLSTNHISSQSKNEIDQLTLATSRMSKSFSLSMRKTSEARAAAKQAIRAAKALKEKHDPDQP